MRNDVTDSVSLRTGTIEVVPESGFDVITANITREVLRDLFPAFHRKMSPGGCLQLSGVFARDRDVLLASASDHGFTLRHDATEDGWWAGQFRPDT
jgi:ribosomal protein L11 methyltransferase